MDNNVNQDFMRSVILLRSFSDIQKNMMLFIQRNATENGLTVSQYSILMTIIRHKEITQKVLGEEAFLPKSTLSQAIDGLVKRGLLQRHQVDGNRREVLLSTSKKGVDFIKSIHTQEGGIHQIFQAAVETLTEKQYDDLLVAHLQLSTFLEKYHTEQGGLVSD
ncbi:MarR family winged helix-turn-helix transcriptional regulator [Virgibacillus ndiopensis]|uniref:MarR family winged helix-turn-helix transcriptional regulator n=1 Tax=Virgibacillus ndiopensis TaxID=2004408 RepID=UPI000C071A95|nr:MarR family transcriptional regulator [Virgibacillus ndiopensis]